MHKYTEEQIETKPEDLTVEHSLGAELACMLAQEAGNRDDWEACRAWLEVADNQPFYRRIPDEPFLPVIDSRTPKMGGVLHAPGGIGEISEPLAYPGLSPYECELLARPYQWHGAIADQRADDCGVASRPGGAASMTCSGCKGAHAEMHYDRCLCSCCQQFFKEEDETMTPPPADSPKLLRDTLGFIAAVIIALYALSMIEAHRDYEDQTDAGAVAP